MKLVTKFWLGFFIIWVLTLSGGLTNLGSPPGILQAVKLRGLLHDRQDRLQELEAEIQNLHAERAALESSDWAQEKEIRSRLGYLAADEIAFE